MPLGTKLAIWSILLLAFVLLFVFGFTFFLIALAGALVTFLANLLGIGGRRNVQSTTQPYPPDSRHQRRRPDSSSRKYRDDDDVIDV